MLLTWTIEIFGKKIAQNYNFVNFWTAKFQFWRQILVRQMLNLQKRLVQTIFCNETFNGGRYAESEKVALEIHLVPNIDKLRGPKIQCNVDQIQTTLEIWICNLAK